MLIKSLSTVIKRYLAHKAIVLGGCCPYGNMIHIIGWKIKIFFRFRTLLEKKSATIMAFVISWLPPTDSCVLQICLLCNSLMSSPLSIQIE